MNIETERIIIRSIQRGDEKAYAEMAKDGSLAEIGFDENFSDWAENWINEAVQEYITYFFDHYISFQTILRLILLFQRYSL